MPSDTVYADALTAYISLLEKNGSKRADLSLKDHLARKLIANLGSSSLDNRTYRIAVDATIESLPAEYKAGTVQVAREMFPLLLSDVKAVVALMKSGGYRDFSKADARVDGSEIKSVKALIRASQSFAYSTQQIALHEEYEASLFAVEADDDVMTLRLAIAKTLLYLTRKKEISPTQYRTVIDSVLPLIDAEKTRLYFVMVAREYYHFLTSDPNAAKMIALTGEPVASQSILQSNDDWQHRE